MHHKREGANPLIGGAIPLKEGFIPLKEDLVTSLHCTIIKALGQLLERLEAKHFLG